MTMTPRALRAHAARWFLRGFRLSGKGFHGENYDTTKHPSLESLLLAEFDRIYDAEEK